MSRWAWAEVSSAAIEHNVQALARLVAPAQVWAVVKADGYGHGALLAAPAALDGGAGGLCVALVQEGVRLREAGITAPVLVLSEQPAEQVSLAVQHGLQLTVYSTDQLEVIAEHGGQDHPVHLKVDTGMRRVGAQVDDVVRIADAIAASAAVRLEGVFTHLAVADEPGDPYNDRQLDLFETVIARLNVAGHHPALVHAANSAGALAHPRARLSMVRAGIAIYGIAPGTGVASQARGLGLRPALSLYAKVSHVKRVAAGERISYGLRHTFERDTTVATLPLGYADGVPRRLHAVDGSVLIGGVRRHIVGVVTMDQLMVDCGDDLVEVGDDAVLIGRQIGRDGEIVQITADEWADRLDTIAYEIVCGISARIERRAV
ncbi:MAG: alanine racemase [Actinobacteria bacterium]|nr:alanine racemase [Actinomycetota bacterium]